MLKASTKNTTQRLILNHVRNYIHTKTRLQGAVSKES